MKLRVRLSEGNCQGMTSFGVLPTLIPPVPEMLQSSSYSRAFPVISNTAALSFYSDTSPDSSSKSSYEISSRSNSETSASSTPSNSTSAPLSTEYSWKQSGYGVAPTAPDIKGYVVRVIYDIKG